MSLADKFNTLQIEGMNREWKKLKVRNEGKLIEIVSVSPIALSYLFSLGYEDGSPCNSYCVQDYNSRIEVLPKDRVSYALEGFLNDYANGKQK